MGKIVVGVMIALIALFFIGCVVAFVVINYLEDRGGSHCGDCKYYDKEGGFCGVDRLPYRETTPACKYIVLNGTTDKTAE